MARTLGHQPARAERGWFSRTWLAKGYRRAVYDHRPDVVSVKINRSHWEQLHSGWRWWDSMLCMVGPPGHILRNVRAPFLAVMAVTLLVLVLEIIESTLGVETMPTKTDLLIKGFQLTSFIVGLLLTLRINRAYDRWLKARSGYGAVGRGMLMLAQEAAAAFPNDQDLQDELERWAVVLIHCTRRYVLAERQLSLAEQEVLSPQEAEVMEGSSKPLYAALARLRHLVGSATPRLGEQYISLEGAISTAHAGCSDCLGVLEQATPQQLSLLSTGFLLIWLFFLPFGLWEVSSVMWMNLPMMIVMAALFLGCDEVASQLEDPFPLLPLGDMAHRSVNDIRRSKQENRQLQALAAQGLAGGRGQGGKDGSQAAAVAGSASKTSSELDGPALGDSKAGAARISMV